jgi:hypothetical protein
MTRRVLHIVGVACIGCVGPVVLVDGTTTTASGTAEATSSSATTSDDPSTTIGGDPTTNPGTSSSSAGPGVSSSSGSSGFEFAPHDPSEYETLDRVGFAGANMIVNLYGRDEYNAGTPGDDIDDVFVSSIGQSLQTYHFGTPGLQTPGNTGLHDDLGALGFVPCSTPEGSTYACFQRIEALMIPDTLRLDYRYPSSFPNGRRLTDPVADTVLAVVLLDLSTHEPDAFAAMPLNPTANDVAFPAEWPWLAPPH